jgi:hypothetical protein
MTALTFPYRDNFPTLTDGQIDAAIANVSVEWYGAVNELWAGMNGTVRDAKRNLVLGYLTAWWLSNFYPSAVVGIVSDGGKPLSSKTIGGTSLTYGQIESQPALAPLLSNTFGINALIAMQSAPERYTIYG